MRMLKSLKESIEKRVATLRYPLRISQEISEEEIFFLK
jgi:hypothetical protein